MPGPARPTPHLAYCGGSFGRVSLMSADTELADHARDCAQLLVNVQAERLPLRVDGVVHHLRPFEAAVIEPRQTYAITGLRDEPSASLATARPAILLVKACTGPALPRASRTRLATMALPGAARDDAAQLVADLLVPTPDPAALERGVRALQDASAALLERVAPQGLRAPSPRERIARGIEALHDLREFGSTGQHAAACAMSERHFLTLCRRATRLPPRAFYNMLRLDAAFALLGDASRPIADIAYQLGFSAPPHFTRFMRANTGWTPSGYRTHLLRLPPALRPQLTMPWPHAPQ